MKIEYKKLRGRIVEKFGSQTAFAEAAETSKSAVSQKLNRKIGLTQEDILLWSYLLDIAKADIGEYFFA